MSAMFDRFSSARVRRLTVYIVDLLPGVLLCLALAGASYALAHYPPVAHHLALSPLCLGIVLGIGVRAAVTPSARIARGLAWTMHYLLRLGIVLLGFRLLLPTLLSVGFGGLALVFLATISTLALSIGLGRVLGVSPALSVLIGSGTGICGASAIVAVDGVIRARQADIACAIALVTVFGLIAMFSYPLAARLLALGPHGYGIWAGTSIHEVAQAVAAGFADGDQAGATATLYKLARVALLAPICTGLAVGWRARRDEASSAGRSGLPVPLFLILFVLVVLFNSAVGLPAALTAGIAHIAAAVLTVAMVATGLSTSPGALASVGPRPIVLAAIVSIWISALALGGAILLGGSPT